MQRSTPSMRIGWGASLHEERFSVKYLQANISFARMMV